MTRPKEKAVFEYILPNVLSLNFVYFEALATEPSITCSKLTIETLEQNVK